ncbi:MAG: hypothetical protein FJ335_02470 [Sphingomonadales bacterium]|nr:hypothetical protein [Sphingomonadales bacterium]
MERVALAGLLRIDLPTRSILLCDGGFLPVGDDVFQSVDPVFGTVAGFEALTEGVGDELPIGKLTFLPAKVAAAIELSRPGYQGSRVRLWVAEIGADGRPVGELEPIADWQTDKTVLKRMKNSRSLEMVCVSRSQRLLIRNDGNALSTASHQRVFPGERGHDNAVGMEIEVAWGVASPPRGVQAA